MRFSNLVLTLLPVVSNAAETDIHRVLSPTSGASSPTPNDQERKLRGPSGRTSLANDNKTVGTSSSVTLKSSEDPPNPDYFKPAMPIEFFQNIDPERFEWVNPAEVQAGETTCGFLKAPFAWPAGSTTGFTETDDQDQYPIAKVYVCVRFADVQPAPRGNMAVHCGGPGSLSDCVYKMGDKGKTHKLGYNVIGFDQRGMGRSTPTFVVPECTLEYYYDDLSQSDQGILSSDADFSDEAYARAKARWAKARNLGCWNHEDFLVPVDETDGDSETYHFLQYSGTRQLAEDIERVRILFGDQKISVHGVSYGTAVMGTYVTVFPRNVNLMVLDGNMIPSYDVAQYVEDDARSFNQRIDYFIASCEFGNQGCGVRDMRACVNQLSDAIRENRDDIQENYGEVPMSAVMAAVITSLFGNYDLAPDICAAAADDDLDELLPLLKKLIPPDDEKTVFLKEGQETDTESKPTSAKKPDWPFEGYQDSVGAVMIVHSQDLAFGAYDEDLFVRFLQELDRKYPGAGTGEPVMRAAADYGRTYYWPNITPLAPMGNPDQRGIVAGQLYDPRTSYIWTQKMRQSFKRATLLTSRSVNHGMHTARDFRKNGNSDPECQNLIVNYFKKGYVDFVDGHVCESEPIGDSCTIDNIIKAVGNNDYCGVGKAASTSHKSSLTTE